LKPNYLLLRITFINATAGRVLNIVRSSGSVSVGPQFFDTNLSSGRALNVDAFVGRDRSFAVAPLLNGRRLYANCSGERRLATQEIACFEYGLLSGRVHEN
jgi:hypothetical protein